MNKLFRIVTLIGVLMTNLFASGSELGSLPLFSVLPFAGILLSIAILPLVRPHFWEHNFGKISAFWATLFFFPFWFLYGTEIAFTELFHVLLLEYIPFIILLLALFTISGGIRLKGSLVGTPKLNTIFLLIGTSIASWMGTTGASMLLIRPLIRANKWRKKKVHIFVFFIFLVANIGGSLSPLGDPPLFLGFLKGVDFFWTTKNLFVPMLVVASILIVVFYILDNFYYQKEIDSKPADPEVKEKISLDGNVNLLFLLGVIFFVLLSGIWKPHYSMNFMHIHLELQNIIRDISLLILTFLSVKYTKPEIRSANAFTWFPIEEVAKLFVGIFITIIPAIAILKAGSDGALAGIVNSTQNLDGSPNNMMYFWLTGILSSFLDNAPTYLVFFNTAGGNAMELMTTYSNTLLAISCGAVFMGANTYIGNAPNFMVRAIAEENDIDMPSFFGFMLWSTLILIPVFIIISILFF
ncbi:MAG: sodium:proton antiporter [Candidatus Marinimicrobia bacterium]|nr:sodium:proton antiporter [Candidatus Neomarinimicrobiota bacterium]